VNPEEEINMQSVPLRTRIAQVLLWISVINFGIYIGGTLYQMLVIVPQWSASIPESLRAFYAGDHVNLNHTLSNFFGPKTMLIRNLPLIGALVFAWHSPLHRKYLFVGLLCMTVFGLIFTVFYIYPVNDVLFTQAGGSLSAEECSALASRWIWADRIRLAVVAIGYLAMLRAFSVPFTRNENS
jgi:Domain of unknown function (DUF1772)